MATSDDVVFLSFTFVIALSLTLALGLWGRLIASGERPLAEPTIQQASPASAVKDP